MSKLVIKRKFSLPAAGVKMKVFIDEKYIGEIWFNTSLEMEISEGKHYIRCDAGGVVSDDIYFKISPHSLRNVQCSVGFDKISCAVM